MKAMTIRLVTPHVGRRIVFVYIKKLVTAAGGVAPSAQAPQFNFPSRAAIFCAWRFAFCGFVSYSEWGRRKVHNGAILKNRKGGYLLSPEPIPPRDMRMMYMHPPLALACRILCLGGHVQRPTWHGLLRSGRALSLCRLQRLHGAADLPTWLGGQVHDTLKKEPCVVMSPGESVWIPFGTNPVLMAVHSSMLYEKPKRGSAAAREALKDEYATLML